MGENLVSVGVPIGLGRRNGALYCAGPNSLRQLSSQWSRSIDGWVEVAWQK